MSKINITKIFEFSAAHYLPNHEGLCKQLHGHTYKLEVTVSAKRLITQGPQTGMIVDFSVLKSIMKERLKQLDHSLLNDRWLNPTAEIMVMDIAIDLNAEFGEGQRWDHDPIIQLDRLRLWETSTSYAEWRRD